MAAAWDATGNSQDGQIRSNFRWLVQAFRLLTLRAPVEQVQKCVWLLVCLSHISSRP